MGLFNKSKNLNECGVVVFGHHKTRNKINGITNKLLIMRSYRLQRLTLGYVVMGGVVTYDRTTLTRDIHRRMNHYLPHYKQVLCHTNYLNSISLCAKIVKSKDLRGFNRLSRSDMPKIIFKRWGITENFFM